MKDEEFAQVKIEDLKKTYDEECDDVKRVLRKMYPEIFKVQHCCSWMKGAIEIGLIHTRTSSGQDHPAFIASGILNIHLIENGMYYCPRCGTKLTYTP